LIQTQYLFTYGTLQEELVQQEIFGRKLRGKRDVLLGYKLSEKKLMGQYPVIESTGDANDRIAGQIYKVTNLDLFKADAYETQAYKRITVTLASGKQAWTYIENSG